MFKAFALYSLLMGLDLDGLMMGVNIAPPGGGSYEFTISEKSFITRGGTAWVGYNAYTQTGRIYQDGAVESLTFALRMLPHTDFDLFGVNSRYGFTGAVKLSVDNMVVELKDDKYAVVVNQVRWYPSVGIFLSFYTSADRTSGFRIMGELDADRYYPNSGKAAILFSIGL